MTGKNPKLGLVNVDVQAKFGQILSVRSQDIKGHNCLKLGLVNVVVYTKFGIILSIHSQDFEWNKYSRNQGITERYK